MQCLACHCRSDIGIAIAIASDPRSEADHLRNVFGANCSSVDLLKGASHLLVNLRKCLDHRSREVVQAEFDLVHHARLPPPHLVGLPQCSDLGGDLRLSLAGFGVGQRQQVEFL